MDWKTAITFGSAMVSVVALYVSWWLWRETNRPIVTVEVDADVGNVDTFYHLVVYNCGNRPATKIRMSARSESKDAALAHGASTNARQQLYSCFSAENEISLLRHGESTRGGFGVTSISPDQNDLVYGAAIPVTVTYEDLHGRKYKADLTITVRNSKSFNDFWYENVVS